MHILHVSHRNRLRSRGKTPVVEVDASLNFSQITPKFLRILKLIQESHPYHHISSIAFNMADFYDSIKAGNPIDVCYSIVENYYRGTANTQLSIKDIREREELV